MFATELECFRSFKYQHYTGAKIKLTNVVPLLSLYAIHGKRAIFELNWGLMLLLPLIRYQFLIKIDADVADIRCANGGHGE